MSVPSSFKCLQRRAFVRLLGAELALAASACNDERIVVMGPGDGVPSDALEYLPFVEAYFGLEALDSAALVGQFRVQARDVDVEAAFESTRVLRNAIDAGGALPDAILRLEERIQQDFETLQVTDIEGWTLASSEVDLCVLAWLVVDTNE